MKKTTAALTSSLGLVIGSLHAQSVPPFINYQGKVTDSNGVGLGTGTPVNRKVIFRIFDAATGGNRLWSEQHTVTISNGEFSVLLGNGIDAVYNSATETPTKTNTPLDTVFTTPGILRYVEILVDNGDNTINTSDAPIAPRQQITSTAYSFRARSADTIASGTDLQINGSANYGMGYYGSGRTFNGTAVDGPVIYGQSGGALGSVNGSTKNIALRWNAAGAVGVGSADLSGAAATTKLVLQGDDANTAPLQLNIRGNADTNRRLLLGYNTTTNYGSVQSYGAASTGSVLSLNPAGGNVGIGTATAGAKLTVAGNIGAAGDISSSGILYGNGVNITGGIGASGDVNAARIAANGTSGFSFNTNDSDGGLFSPADGTVIIKTDAAERVRVTNTSVGIGTITAQTTLDVRSGSPAITVATPAGDQGALYFGNPNHGVKRNYSGSNDVGLYTTAGDLYLSAQGVGATGGFALKSNGNVGIGTSAPGAKLTVQSDGTAVQIQGSDTSKQLQLAYNVVGDYSTIQSIHQGVVYTPLALQLAGGNVGVGTSAPSAPLDVARKQSVAFFRLGYVMNSGFNDSDGSDPWNLSIRSAGAISAEAFVVSSDERIKDVMGVSNGSEDLKALQGIEITNYKMKDPSAGSRAYKKVIAQQVEKVYPQAVNKNTSVLPDILANVKIDGGWVSLLPAGLKAGDRVRLVCEKDDRVCEVLEVDEQGGRFRTDFKSSEDTVFVYGREVKDFRMVDYDAISMLNVSATQQLKHEKDAEVQTLRDENAALRAKLSELESRDATLATRISSIENALLAADKKTSGNTSTVSVKKADTGE